MKLCRYGTVLVISLFATLAEAQQFSRLWGESGELFDPEGRLPDFSYAGYAFGDRPLPSLEPVASVTDFGADGADEIDDTEAFREAIATSETGAIVVPAGRYIISDILWIERPGIVLRGAGAGETTLHITTTLEAVRPNMSATSTGEPTSGYSWSGGFIWARGGTEGSPAVPISEDAARGQRTIHVEDIGAFSIGQRVLIEQRDDEECTLVDHLSAGDPGDTRKLRGPIKPRVVARIEQIVGNEVTLNRPLRWDIRSRWNPTLRGFLPRVHDVGIEGVTISFDAVAYEGHFTEQGRNAIAFNGTSDCWVRDVTVVNCDSAVFFTGVQGTIDGLRVVSERDPNRGVQGHHGVTLGSDNVVTNFRFDTHFIHDITMTRLSAGNVVKNGSGTNLSLDHHKSINFANLFCNIDAGDGSDLWRCGGGASLGKNTGAWATFWGVSAQKSLSWPRDGFGPDRMSLVGLTTNHEDQLAEDGRWFEVIEPAELSPRDLHAAQLERRNRSDG